MSTAARGRIELGFEHLDQQTRKQRVARERLLDIGLRERHADLLQVLAVAAQHRHLAPGQSCGEDEAIETVVLGIAAPDLFERVLEIGIGTNITFYATPNWASQVELRSLGHRAPAPPFLGTGALHPSVA